jgi:ABC-2 type transport system ATP-binding protein
MLEVQSEPKPLVLTSKCRLQLPRIVALREDTSCMAVATLSNLTVRYGPRTVIPTLTIEVPEGSVGLLGPNGAGKTTLIKTLLGFLSPVSGGGTILGLNVASQGLRIRQHVGLMPETDCHIPGMSAVAFVAYTGELAGMPSSQALRRAHEVLEYCGLGEARYRDVDTYSTGMKQRIKLAQALVHGPSLIFLDEPTNGLDPEGRDYMLDLIYDISHGKGVNVVVSSHLLPDIERTCDYVIVLKEGQVKAQGDISTLRGASDTQIDVELREPSERFVDIMERQGAQLHGRLGSRYRFALLANGDGTGKLLFEAARESGAQLRGFKSARRTLEDIFLEAIR